ncbi:DEAD/DEAH family ATP-dependent RNA helicase [Buchnera aphidicola (Aphis nasturtii)]|uniref:DEAD/DEAH family ATP-dependent RNA helicase n=1 Tax=Buchnera aphidicola TaxID=9 RepID=UPI0010C52699|nr:DEAD/DEAH family ATP-dependent RNA helicase [Buchnera aphidicola]QCI18342.1 DEAD/DEAH family ATP-dependent RNA helicase [Buchnera aphidicola (Aphis nasturtii)]
MTHTEKTFSFLGLNPFIIQSLNEMGYVKPSPIQAACIPLLLQRKDVLGMAQTGSGKTAAFSLPLLHNLKINLKAPQILVLAPTRELAVQVAEAFSIFSKYIVGVNVLPLYGGQRYELQLRALKQGPQIVVGTPGRLLDHLKRGTLNLSNLHGLVLDEADEMLRMGFIEDVETIMSKIPKEHQTALFSATMPEVIRRISKRFMNNPEEIKIKSNITTRPDIKQSYWMVYGKKTDALIRFLEVEEFSATIIFVKTKNATLEVAEALERHGYNSAALNGDMNQALREQTLERLKNGKLDILIATDVAARGLDVDRISFVINYDIPMDSESYVHRIGRTGRAGRAGRALLFVENRERRLLRNIERTINQSIPEVQLPRIELLCEKRIQQFSKKVQQQLESKDLNEYISLLDKLYFSDDLDLKTLAAALLKMAQGGRPLIIKKDLLKRPMKESFYKDDRRREENRNNRYRRDRKDIKNIDLYRIEIGRNDGVEVRHIVGAIANEGNINSRNIGNIKLFSSYSIIELPTGLSKELLQHLVKTRILNKPINIKLLRNSRYHQNRSYNRSIANKDINTNRRFSENCLAKSHSTKNEIRSSFFRRKNI